MTSKKSVRKTFRRGVLARDNFMCQCCGSYGYDRQEKTGIGVPLDAHHITDDDGTNSVLENGIAVCDGCHWKAERFHISQGREWVERFHPNDLYARIGSNWRI